MCIVWWLVSGQYGWWIDEHMRCLGARRGGCKPMTSSSWSLSLWSWSAWSLYLYHWYQYDFDPCITISISYYHHVQHDPKATLDSADISEHSIGFNPTDIHRESSGGCPLPNLFQGVYLRSGIQTYQDPCYIPWNPGWLGILRYMMYIYIYISIWFFIPFLK